MVRKFEASASFVQIEGWELTNNRGDKMIYEIVITADTNDADYITKISAITPDELERFTPLIAEIAKKVKHYNWETSENGDDEDKPEIMYSQFAELVEEFGEFVPHGEHGVHTIESIVYYEKPTKIVLL
jgi:DNA polymerase III alpha subunit (gram-positive type)